MQYDTIFALTAAVRKETEDIWLDEPQDVYNIKNGYLGSEAGVDGQYFSPLVMLSGEIRCLGTHIFADLSQFAQYPELSLATLKKMTHRMLRTDVGVISFFGLRRYGALLENFDALVDTIVSKEAYADIISAFFVLTNRYQMWLHQIFPWGYGSFMPRRGPEAYEEIAKRMRGRQ